jgi:hypothetical protein
VTAEEWDRCRDPVKMLLFLEGRRVPAHRLRLFAAACCRRAWASLADGRSRDAVPVLERYADGPGRKADLDELKAAYRAAGEATAAAREPRQHYAATMVERAAEPTQAWWAPRWSTRLLFTAAGKAGPAAGVSGGRGGQGSGGGRRGGSAPRRDRQPGNLDSLHPNRLRCDRCGWAVPVALDITDDPAGLCCLTEDEAADYWPGLGPALRLHAMLCPGAWFADQEKTEAMAAPR